MVTGWCIEEFCEECDEIASAVVKVEKNRQKKGKGIGSGQTANHLTEAVTPVAWWGMDEISGAVASDSVGE